MTAIPPSEGAKAQDVSHELTDIQLKDFSILGIIGRGAFGKVYLCRMNLDQQVYSMKAIGIPVLREAEIFVMKTVQHHFLMPAIYQFKEIETHYIVMPFAIGGSLEFHLKQNTAFKEETACFYISELVLAVGYLHSKKIDHCDVKLANIMLDHSGHILLGDFGLAEINMPSRSTVKEICGTTLSMAPETFGKVRYERVVDWWQTGVCLYKMITGFLPFQSVNEIICQDVKFPLFIVSYHAEHLITLLLAKDPEKRLGGGPTDCMEIQSHNFFSRIKWSDLQEKKIVPPFKPEISADADTKYFEK